MSKVNDMWLDFYGYVLHLRNLSKEQQSLAAECFLAGVQTTLTHFAPLVKGKSRYEVDAELHELNDEIRELIDGMKKAGMERSGE